MSCAPQSCDRAAAPAVLAIETSTEVGSVALVQGDGVLAAAHHVGGPELSGWVLPAVARLLRECGLTKPDAVACGIGPGAFTGVRTACATAQALAWGWSVPLHAAGSLLAFVATHFVLAEAAGELPTSGRWAVLMDARQSETYAAVWEVGEASTEGVASVDVNPHPPLRGTLSRGERVMHFLSLRERAGVRADLRRSGSLRPIAPPALVPDAKLASWLTAHAVEHVLGSAVPKLGEHGLARVPVARFQDVLRQSALGVAHIATAVDTPIDPLDLQPLYVRDRVALTEAERAANRLGLAAPSSVAGVS